MPFSRFQAVNPYSPLIERNDGANLPLRIKLYMRAASARPAEIIPENITDFMPSSFSHAVAAVAFGRAYTTRPLPVRFWVLSIGCSLAPDLDVLGSRFGIGLDTMLGHRGITHSFFFALILSGLVILLAFREPVSGISRKALFFYFFAVTAMHPILDALVDGVWGVAFFAPFSSTRYFLPWRPIHSSPLGMNFFSSAGATVILNELVWVWVPSTIAILAPGLGRRFLTTDRLEKN